MKIICIRFKESYIENFVYHIQNSGNVVNNYVGKCGFSSYF